MAKRSNYQQRVIRDYYKNRETLMLQRLGELVTELYLAEGKRRGQLWKRARQALENLQVPPRRIEHVVSSDNPVRLAELVRELQGGGQ
ncbi:MAG TPA: hypothetical protein EYP56_20265 [Planctomycetaceae bacterium]|nr:hypothetical protein [Planctomycetaceae bacterium]HIQ22146.1 hypothetical protein [Planctomycetota bacterium]